MIRRLFIYGVTLGYLLLVWTQAVEAQCTGQYANDPDYAMLLPKDYAAQGDGRTNVTATIVARVSDISGGVASHNLTVTPNTWVGFSWQGNNGSYSSQYYTVDNDPTQHNNTWTSGLSGTSAHVWNFTNSFIGHSLHQFFVVTDSNGNTSMDRTNITVVAGSSPGIVFQDGLDTNFYQQVTTTGGGSSMLASCTECAGTGGGLPHCINATHTPYSTINLTNSNSGESQSLPWQQSGNVARSNESVSFSASLAISVLPGDSGTISIEHKITCIMDGIIFDQQLPKPKTSPSGGSWNPSVTGELAFTKVALKVPTHCTPLLDSNGNVIGLHCDVAYYCTARSSPPDYQPTGLDTYHYTNPALVPPFWMSMAPGTALVFGKNQPGEIAIWYFPFATLHGVLTNVGGMDPLLLDILSPAWASDNSAQDCTKWISGISPWYMPKW